MPIFERVVSASVAEARGTADEAALAQRIQEGNETIRRELTATYGERASDLIARADKFTKQFQKLHAMLGKNGIGSDPAIVIPIVEHVHRTNYR